MVACTKGREDFCRYQSSALSVLGLCCPTVKGHLKPKALWLLSCVAPSLRLHWGNLVYMHFYAHYTRRYRPSHAASGTTMPSNASMRLIWASDSSKSSSRFAAMRSCLEDLGTTACAAGVAPRHERCRQGAPSPAGALLQPCFALPMVTGIQ